MSEKIFDQEPGITKALGTMPEARKTTEIGLSPDDAVASVLPEDFTSEEVDILNAIINY
jgi:hypothetical protein